MKKILTLIFMLLTFCIITSCNEQENSNLTNLSYHTEYDRYYSYDDMKGLELYCFEKNGEYNCCLMKATDQLKTVEEIKKLQDELPCPISAMKDILLTYSAEDRKNISISVVSYPVKAEELNHSEANTANEEVITTLIKELSLQSNADLNCVYITPLYSSGMIYANVGDEVQLSFSVIPGNSEYTDVSWYSTDSKVVTVTSDGKVKCKTEGTATIIVSVDGVIDAIPIKVSKIKNEKYNVTVTGSTTSLMEQLKSSYKAGTKVQIKAYPTTDVTLHVFMNDVEVAMSHFDSDYWGFEFIMPEEDITIYLTYDQFYGKDDYTFGELYYWVNNLNENVEEISVSSRRSDAPFDSFTEVTYTKDINDIKNILKIFDQKLVKWDEKITPGFLEEKYTFNCNDSSYEITFVDGNVYWYDFSSSQSFRFAQNNFTIPKIQNGHKTYKLAFYGLPDKLYRNNEAKELVNDRIYGISDLEFVTDDTETLYDSSKAKYILEGLYGTLFIIDDEHFVFNDKCYIIVSEQNFRTMIPELV